MKVTTIDPNYFKPVQVELCDFAPGEAGFSKAVRKFRKIVEKQGFLKAAVERKRGYVKPSERRHRAKRRAIYFRKQERERFKKEPHALR